MDGSLGWPPLFALSFVGGLVFLAATGVIPLDVDGRSQPSPPKEAAVGPGDSGGGPLVKRHRLVRLGAAGAMDQLVAGELTLEATALWNHSEKGALRRIDRFMRLDADLRATPNGCHSRDTSTGAAAACAEAAHAVERTIAAARTAVRTWRIHIREMDNLRTGLISAEQARDKWHRLWKTGQVQTVRYDHRAAIALGRDCS